MKPLFKWTGGKSDELQHIRKHFPVNFDIYIEPFVGGGAVFFDLNPDKAVINDIHPELTAFYRQIKDGNATHLYDAIKDLPVDEEGYYNMRDGFDPVTDFDKALQFYYLRKTCYRGMLRYNRSGHFNIPYGRYKNVKFEELQNTAYTDLLQRTDVLNLDFTQVFEQYNSPDNFCFIDQPYDSVFTNYGYCEFGRAEQESLARCFKDTDIKCLMVVADTDFIRQLYDGYIVESYPKKYRFKIHSGRVNEAINKQHLIIKNF